jgi:membrane-associated protein
MKKFLPLFIVLVVFGLGAAGYLSIEHYGLQALISVISVYGVAGIVFAESGLLIGFFLPGDSLLFTAGFLVHQDIIQFNIHLLALILFGAAALGDSVGYTFGKKVGRRLFNRKDSVLFHKENLQRTEEFYKKHGGKAIVIARFIPVIRTFAPIVAGVSHMHYKQFLAFNLIGAFVWAVGLTYLGYFAGSWIEQYGINIEYVILGIIFLSIAPPLIHILKDKKQRTTIIREVKKQLSAFFSK